MSAQYSSPIEASEYYARYVMWLLNGSRGADSATQSLEKIQVLLMLGYHEWSMCRGRETSLRVGEATRIAQLMDMDTEMVFRPTAALTLTSRPVLEHPGTRSDPKVSLSESQGPESIFDEAESKRQTFRSCLILDTYLGCGRIKSTFEVRQNLSLELSDLHEPDPPISDNVFREENYLQVHSSSLFLRRGFIINIVTLWGMVARWSYEGGRRTEECPPWSPQSQFDRLQKDLNIFSQNLPEDWKYSEPNLLHHISKGTAPIYCFIHATYFLCLIFLHREYVPFFPSQLEKPCGPIDGHPFPTNEYNVPDDFWDDSAIDCFKSARNIIDMCYILKEKRCLPHNPITCFALYTAAFTRMYCVYFPKMDTKQYLSGRDFLANICIEELLGSTDLKQSQSPMMSRYIEILPCLEKLIKSSRQIKAQDGGVGLTIWMSYQRYMDFDPTLQILPSTDISASFNASDFFKSPGLGLSQPPSLHHTDMSGSEPWVIAEHPKNAFDANMFIGSLDLDDVPEKPDLSMAQTQLPLESEPWGMVELSKSGSDMDLKTWDSVIGDGQAITTAPMGQLHSPIDLDYRNVYRRQDDPLASWQSYAGYPIPSEQNFIPQEEIPEYLLATVTSNQVADRYNAQLDSDSASVVAGFQSSLPHVTAHLEGEGYPSVLDPGNPPLFNISAFLLENERTVYLDPHAYPVIPDYTHAITSEPMDGEPPEWYQTGF
ncbi:MAG: hypothetical protein M1814_002859 [Vezdaea aestivalis]|nr:MAG: hypothetical protein M1814_002859 [Vezdaea aestivalis]